MNPAVENMLEKYSCNNRMEYERAIKEIIQEIALVGLWRSKFFEKAAFYGGTSLRILYHLNRFSEDMDFTLLEPDPEFSLDRYNDAIARELISYGFTVEVDKKSKSWNTPIRSAFIKANTLGEMIKIGIPSQLTQGLHPDTMLKIKLEVDTDPAPVYKTETRILEQPIAVGIRSVILRDIYAGKMHAMLFREWRGRVKGRDWYDWLWLTQKKIPFDVNRFAIHMRKAGKLEADGITIEKFQQLVRDKIESVDLESAKADIYPYVSDRDYIDSWSKELFNHTLDRMIFTQPS